MKPYSEDLRGRVIAALQEKTQTQPAIAARFAVSLSFVEKLWRRWRATASYSALPRAGGRERLLQAAETMLREEVARQPDATLAELCERVARRAGQPPVSLSTMSDELQRLRLPRKKKDAARGGTGERASAR